MLDFVNRNVLQPLAALKAGSRHLQHLKYLRRSQFDAPSVVRGRQWAKLKMVLDHAYRTVPYYRQAWDAADVHPSDIRSLDDLKALPIVSKTDVRTREADFLSSQFPAKSLIVKRTSGSTGVPLTIRIDEAGKQWKAACTIRSDEWSGYRLGQRVAKVWGNPEYRHFGWKGRLRNLLLDRATYLDTLSLDDRQIRQFISAVRNKPPGLLFGHAHSLYLFAKRLESDGVTDVRPSGIISTAMPLHSWQRQVMERVFGVAPTNRYGCEEVSLIACECEVHRGLHVNADSVFVEIESANSQETVDGVTGNLLVTDLSNFAMPLIRYRIGDVATLSRRTCACGRGLPLLESIEGREADFVVTPAGRMISGISLTENFALHIRGAAQVQVIQETVHHLRIRLVPDERFGRESERQIENLVVETFGPGVRHEVECVSSIPQEPSGKYRFCISKVAKAELRAAA
ncbi:MAG: phenylacetate--CoA ligase family protein [Gemmataceae bacterium]